MHFNGSNKISFEEVLVILKPRKNWKEPLPYNTVVMVSVVF